MGSRNPDDYVSAAGAAQELGVTTRTIHDLVKRGVLHPHHRQGRRALFFLKEDLHHFLAAKKDTGTDLWQVKSIALAALSSARRAEMRLAEIYERLGMEVEVLGRDSSSVRSLYATAQTNAQSQLSDTDWLKFWAGTFFAMDEAYLALVEHEVGSDEPWKVFMDFASAIVASALKNSHVALLPAFRYFQAARDHLRYVSYMYCRQRHGRQITAKVFDSREVTAVDEICALLDG